MAKVSSDGKHAVFVRNLEQTLLHTLTGHSACAAIAFSADNARLVTGSADKTVRIWDPQVPLGSRSN